MTITATMAERGEARVAHATRSRDEANTIYRRALHGRHEDRMDRAVADGIIEGWTRNGGLYDITVDGATITFDPLATWAAMNLVEALDIDRRVFDALTA